MKKSIWIVLLGLATGSLRAESGAEKACTNSSYAVNITNVSREGMAGYMKGSSTIGFYVAPGQTREVQMQAAPGKQEYRTQVFLQDNSAGKSAEDLADSRCAEYVLTPSGCPSGHTAAYLYLYQSKGEPRCFIRSVERPQRALAKLASVKP